MKPLFFTALLISSLALFSQASDARSAVSRRIAPATSKKPPTETTPTSTAEAPLKK